MRENQSPSQYNIAFIETKPDFNRYDIIPRIIYSFKHTVMLDNLIIVYPRKHSIHLVVCKNKQHKCLDEKVSIEEFLQKIIKDTYIIHLTENAPLSIHYFRPWLTSISKSYDKILFLSGIHSDIPYSLLERIREISPGIELLSLGRVPYLASSIPIIIDLLISTGLAEII